MLTGRPDHIEDVLIPMHEGQWFGWADSKNKVYTNLVQLEEHPIPAEAVVNQALIDAQAAWDADNAPYRRNRKGEFPSFGDQFDMIYHDLKNGTTTFIDTIEIVKNKYPKP